jgi:hypothetical protein
MNYSSYSNKQIVQCNDRRKCINDERCIVIDTRKQEKQSSQNETTHINGQISFLLVLESTIVHINSCPMYQWLTWNKNSNDFFLDDRYCSSHTHVDIELTTVCVCVCVYTCLLRSFIVHAYIYIYICVYVCVCRRVRTCHTQYRANEMKAEERIELISRREYSLCIVSKIQLYSNAWREGEKKNLEDFSPNHSLLR